MPPRSICHCYLMPRERCRLDLCLRGGFTCLATIARARGFAIPDEADPNDGISLTYEDFVDAIDRLASVDFPLERTNEEAWLDFVGWRVNYEAAAYAIARAIDAPPALWSGPRRRPIPAIAPLRPATRKADGAAAESSGLGEPAHAISLWRPGDAPRWRLWLETAYTRRSERTLSTNSSNWPSGSFDSRVDRWTCTGVHSPVERSSSARVPPGSGRQRHGDSNAKGPSPRSTTSNKPPRAVASAPRRRMAVRGKAMML